jgi:hypothetical protein
MKKTLSESIRDTMNKLEEAPVPKDSENGLDITTMIDRLESSSEFKSFFNSSQVVDDNGHPLICYHGSPSGYKEDFWGLTHFGPFEIAKGFTYDGHGQASNVVGAYFLNIKNPLEMNDIGFHSLGNYLREFENIELFNRKDTNNIIKQALSIAKQEESELESLRLTSKFVTAFINDDEDLLDMATDEQATFLFLIDNKDEPPNSELQYKIIELMVPILKSKGIYGIKYENDWEGEGGDNTCWIPLDANQIAPVERFMK